MRIVKRASDIIKRQLLPFQHREILSRNSNLKDTRIGKRCFIFGNGPSIKNIDVAQFHDEETFVVNAFWNHDRYSEMKPKYHLIIDADIFRIVESQENYWAQELIANNKKIESAQTKLFLHHTAKNLVESSRIFSTNDIHYLVLSGHLEQGLKFSIEPDKILPNPKNVVVTAIMLAAYMGFQEIYILGCEHDFLAYPKHYEGFKHFYKNPEYDQTNPEHIQKYALAPASYESQAFSVYTLFKNYRLLKEKLANVRPDLQIYNATPKSFLDVFPFRDLNEIKPGVLNI